MRLAGATLVAAGLALKKAGPGRPGGDWTTGQPDNRSKPQGETVMRPVHFFAIFY
jgi:hypothetical protein